jgi:hypothetical protein
VRLSEFIKNCPFQLFQKPQRTSAFHERTPKEPAALSSSSCVFKKKNLQLANQESEETTHVPDLMCQY